MVLVRMIFQLKNRQAHEAVAAMKQAAPMTRHHGAGGSNAAAHRPDVNVSNSTPPFFVELVLWHRR
jgi:hypothetical protein